MLPTMQASAIQDALRAAWTASYTREGRWYCFGLPQASAADKFLVEFVRPGDLTLFENNDVTPEEAGDWLPLAYLRRSGGGDHLGDFLVVSAGVRGFAVGTWAHDAGITEVWPSFDAFVGSLVQEAARPPLEALKAALAASDSLLQAERQAVVLEQLLPPLKAMPPLDSLSPGPRMEAEHYVRLGWNTVGLCERHLGRHTEALAAFDRASALHLAQADLNALATEVYNVKVPRDALLRVDAIRARKDFWMWPKGDAVWVHRYALIASLDLDDRARAVSELGQIAATKGHARVAREALGEYLEANRPGRYAAELLEGLPSAGPAGRQPK